MPNFTLSDIGSDVLDIRDMIERFEELETQKLESRYAANWNMPGFLPDVEASHFEDAEDALEFLREIARDEVFPNEELAEQIEAWELDEDNEFGQTLGKYHYFISDLGIQGGDLDEEEQKEFELLSSALEEMKGCGGDEQWRGDWYPITLIEESHFTDYAMELLADIGDLPAEIPHYIVIDEDATARNIRMKYTAIELGEFTYWYR